MENVLKSLCHCQVFKEAAVSSLLQHLLPERPSIGGVIQVTVVPNS